MCESVAMATVASEYPQNLISCRSSWGKHPLKKIFNLCRGLDFGTPTMPAADITWTAQGTLTPVCMKLFHCQDRSGAGLILALSDHL